MKTHRLPAESTPAWQAAKTYFEMGVERGIRAVGKKLGKSGTLIERWASKYRWVARARAWDAEQEALEADARQKATEADAVKWARRRAALSEEQYQMSDDLLRKAREGLALPLTRKKTSADGKSITIEPVRFTLSDAARLIDIAAKLRALATGAPTDKTETVQSGTIKIETDEVDLSRLTLEQLEQLETIATQLQPRADSQGKG